MTNPGAHLTGPIVSEEGFKIGTKRGTQTDVVGSDGGLYQMGTAVDHTAAQLNSLTRAETILFIEAATGTYTGDVLVPAEAIIQDIIIHARALWAAATSAVMDVGDFTNAATPLAIDADGFFASIDLKATDLIQHESISFGFTGGKEGAYIPTAAGQHANSHVEQRRSDVVRRIRGVITSDGAGTTGRTTMTVIYTVPTITNATQAT